MSIIVNGKIFLNKKIVINQKKNITPSVITDGLVFYIDINSPSCYTIGSTTINDISGNGYVGTLVNGVSYDSNNGGSLLFDGINNYCTTNFTIPSFSNTSDFTWSVWCYPISLSAAPIIGNRGVNFPALNFIKLQTYSFQYVTNNNFYDVSYNLNIGTWNNVCVVKEDTTLKYYHNGVLVNTTYPSTPTISLPFYIGGDPTANEYSNSKVSSILLYNKSLSLSEVNYNYDLIKSRFGL